MPKLTPRRRAGAIVPISDFGAFLRRLRQDAGMTQAQLAEAATISVRAISDLERGINRTPHQYTVDHLADALELDEATRTEFVAAARGSKIAAPHRALRDAVTGIPPTPLIGREREVADLVARLRQPEVRLLTLTGPGGVGKTRLGVQVAIELRDEFRDMVHFVPLAAITDPALVPTAIAQALGVRDAGESPLDQRLIGYIGAKRQLLVLDNFEQVSAASRFIAGLLEGCPHLNLLVTSRSALRLPYESVFDVPPLLVPAVEQRSLPELAGLGAVALFVQRMTAARADFVLTADNVGDVVAICSELDGLPLAIELAAARGRLLTPRSLLALLSHRLDVLSGGPRGLPARQQTIRNTIVWSYDLLTPAEQSLFEDIAVFAGGYFAEGAAAVATDSHELEARLNALVHASLVREERWSGVGVRYRLLETIRDYALERLVRTGREMVVRQRHAAYFVGVAEEAEPLLRGPDQLALLDRLHMEQDNLRAALSWCAEQGAIEMALRLGGALTLFWQVRGHLAEGRAWLERILAASSGAPDTLRAKALQAGGALAHYQSDYGRAAELYQASLALRRAMGDQGGAALMLNNLGIIADDQGDYPLAIALHEEGLQIRRQLHDRWGIAASLGNLGNVAKNTGDDARAWALYSESLTLFRETGDNRAIAIMLDNLGSVADRLGDYQQAVTLYEESLALKRLIGDRHTLSETLDNLGQAKQELGETASAVALYEESLEIKRVQGDWRGIAITLFNLGRIARNHGDLQRATALFIESLALRRTLTTKESIASSLEALADVAGQEGQGERAARLFGAARRLRTEIGAPIPPDEYARYEHAVATARQTLDPSAFDAAWAAGSVLSLDATIDEALAGSPVLSPPPSPMSP